MTAADFVFDDYMEVAYHDGPSAITLDDISPYWDRFLALCQDCGRPVPEDLTPELYVELWNATYERRVSL